MATSPDGLDTVLGEDGSGWSAGQRARLALARVVVADRPFVLLDEPTAHLDDETERVLLETLVWLARRSVVLVVAHRPAVVAAADHEIRLTPVSGPDEAVPAAVPVPVTATQSPSPGAASR